MVRWNKYTRNYDGIILQSLPTPKLEMPIAEFISPSFAHFFFLHGGLRFFFLLCFLSVVLSSSSYS